MRWLGGHIAAALARARCRRRDASTTGRWPVGRGPTWCASPGCGPGEVLVDGRKLVGHQPAAHPSRLALPVHGAHALVARVLVGLLAEPRPDVDELPPVAVLPADVADALPGAVARGLTAAR